MTKTMNKLTIPSILVVAVMLAGVFAFMPVEQASTVHGTITDEIGAQDRTITFNQLFGGDGANITIPLTSLSENAYSGEVSITGYCNEDDNGTECDAVTFTIEVDTDNNGVADTVVSTILVDTNNAALDFGEDADDLPDGVDQIFLVTTNLDSDEPNIINISVIILLDGTVT